MQNRSVNWNIALLGGFRALANDGIVVERFRTQKALMLLVRILLCAPAPLSREQLGEWLWPDRPPGDQRARLRYELNVLRSALGAAAIRSVGNDFVTLGEGIVSDVSAFRHAVAAARFEEAAALYAGDLLPGIYDDWILEQQTHLRDAARDAFVQAIVKAQREGRIGDARSLRRALFERIPDTNETTVPPLPAPPPPPAEPLSPPFQAVATPGETRTSELPTAQTRRAKASLPFWNVRLRRAFPVLVGAGVYIAVVGAIRAAAPQWDFAADYSTQTPTFHEWSVGSLRLADNAFEPMTLPRKPGETIHTWAQRGGYGNVNKNRATYPIVAYTAQWQAGQASIHPNYGNRPAAAIRWICLHQGAFAVHAHFAGISQDADRGATVNLHARRNAAALWDDEIHGSIVSAPRENPRPAVTHDAVLRLTQNETLTWYVDDAGAFLADQVGVDLTIRPLWAERLLSAAPLLALPLALFAGFAVRRRAANRRLETL